MYEAAGMFQKSHHLLNQEVEYAVCGPVWILRVMDTFEAATFM